MTQKRKKTLLKKAIPIYTIFSFILIISIYLLSPFNQINTLNVEGNNEVVDQEIIQSSNLSSGHPIWGTYVNKEKIEEKITADLPQVSQANISFSGINDFSIEIDEHNTIAHLDAGDSYLKVLENGDLIEDESNTVGEKPVLLNFQDDEILESLVEQLNQIDEVIVQLISEIELVELDRNPLLTRTYMNDESQVLASVPTYAERIRHYPQLSESVDGETGLFDLEAGAYFTPFSSEENTDLELNGEDENEITQEDENRSSRENLENAAD